MEAVVCRNGGVTMSTCSEKSVYYFNWQDPSLCNLLPCFTLAGSILGMNSIQSSSPSIKATANDFHTGRIMFTLS